MTASALEDFVGTPRRRRRSVALAQTKPTDVETNMLIFHRKNAHRLTQREIRKAKRTMDMKQNSCQMRNVSKTIGESKIFEGRMIAKSKIVKINL